MTIVLMSLATVNPPVADSWLTSTNGLLLILFVVWTVLVFVAGMHFKNEQWIRRHHGPLPKNGGGKRPQVPQRVKGDER